MTKTQKIYEAISSLIESPKFYVDNETIVWQDERPQPSSVEIDLKIIEIESKIPMRLLKEERNKKIAATDWRFRSDLTPSQAWIDYCQALRDLPENSDPQLDENGQLTNVNWPIEPAE